MQLQNATQYYRNSSFISILSNSRPASLLHYWDVDHVPNDAVCVSDWPTHKYMCMKVQELWDKIEDADDAAAAAES